MIVMNKMEPAYGRFIDRNRSLAFGNAMHSVTKSADQIPNVVAIYDDERRTIFLPEGWSAATPAQLSLLGMKWFITYKI